jgi:hypothetical protein
MAQDRPNYPRIPPSLAVPSALAVVLVYAASFFLPVYEWERSVHSGWETFWKVVQILIKDPPAGFELWLPNPLLWSGVICLLAGRARAAGLLGTLASLLAAANVYSLREFLLVGSDVWVASMVLLAVLGFVLARSVRGEPRITPSAPCTTAGPVQGRAP